MIRVTRLERRIRTLFPAEEDSLHFPAFQGNPRPPNSLSNTEKPSESRTEALPPGGCAFIEEREDLRARIDTAGRCFSTHTGHAGFVVDTDETSEFRSSPAPVAGNLSSVRALSGLREIVGFVPPLPGLEIDASWVAFEQRIRVLRDQGAEIKDIRRGTRVRVGFHAARDGRRESAVVELTLGRSSLKQRQRIKDAVRAGAGRAVHRLGAVEAPGGERAIVLGPGLGGLWVHELVGHALEADRVQAGRSWLAAAKSPVSSKKLTVIDDPRRGRASWRFDDEGSPSRATPLLRGGRVQGLLHDRRTAQKVGRPPTGHGRRSSFRDPVLPRMGCTFIAPGSLSAEDVLQGIDEGVYVRRMEAATTSTVTGEATFRVTDADRIRCGSLDVPLRPFLLCVDGARALHDVLRIGDDLSFDVCIGSCHRDGQPLSISVGAPTICIGLARVAS